MILKNFFCAIPFAIAMLLSCSQGNKQQSLVAYDKWTVTEPVFDAGKKGTFDEVAVKDPTIVEYNGKWHMFYTSKTSPATKETMPHIARNLTGLGYVTAPSLDELNSAERIDFGLIYNSIIIAPQVFYFGPQKLWYLIAHTMVDGRPDLQPIYMTNPDIEDVYGWTMPIKLNTRKINNGFWIDFWVICDDHKAHLFYTDHEGSMFRFECPIEEFPHGFANKREETVLTERGEDEKGRWRMHEASHIYRVKKDGKYLNLLEAIYPHPTRKHYWDSRSRFLFAMVADKLEGPWRRVELGPNDFLGNPANLYNEDGTKAVYDQVSHPELIRSGYDQRLEIEDYNLDLLFQAFDADTIGDDFNYDLLPWKLMIMRNY